MWLVEGLSNYLKSETKWNSVHFVSVRFMHKLAMLCAQNKIRVDAIQTFCASQT